MKVPALLVEAFAEGPLAGNGAAVVLLEQDLPDTWMQGLARSLNQSETAYLFQQPGGWRLRWFTPTCEVALCGHATLAALLAMGHWGLLHPGESTELHTRSGPLRVVLQEPDPSTGGARGSIELPCGTLQAASCPGPLAALLADLLGSAPTAFWRLELGYAVALLEPGAPLARAHQLGEELAGALDGRERQGLVLMQALKAKSGAKLPEVGGRAADYQLRFFAPGLGINEDPVTGSAHALVAPYWLDQTGRADVVGWQCSPRPGGLVLEPAAPGRMRLQGSGHVLLEGQLQLPGVQQ